MVRATLLALGIGLVAAKTVDLTPSSPSSAPISFPGPTVSQQTLQRVHQKGHHGPEAAGRGQRRGPPTLGKRDGSFHGSEHTPHGGGYSSGPTGHGTGGYSTGGYSAGGYSQPGYSGYESDDYGYTEATTYEGGDGGFLGNIGKYGLIIIPILLGVTLLFLFPSVINIASTGRDNRALGRQGEPSDDLLQRAMSIYTSISEDPVCVNRLFCELGSTLGQTSFANQTLQYFDYFLPVKNNNMLILKKSAQAEDSQCHVLACKAWEDNPESLRNGRAESGNNNRKGSHHRRQQRM